MAARKVLPAVRDSLGAALARLVGTEVDTVTGTRLTAVRFDPEQVVLRVGLASPGELRVEVESGPVAFGLATRVCYGNCLLGCCLSSRVEFEVTVENARVALALDAQALFRGEAGRAAISRPVVDGLAVDFRSPHLGGVLGWLSGAAILAEVLNVVGVPVAVLDALGSDALVGAIRAPLEEAITSEAAGFEFAGLAGLALAAEVPGATEVRLAARVLDPPAIVAGEMHLAVQASMLAGRRAAPVDPIAGTEGRMTPALGEHDVALAVSETAVARLVAELAGMAWMRFEHRGLALGDIAPGVFIPPLGIGSETPIVLVFDPAPAPEGGRVPPTIEFADDPATDGVLEARLAARVRVRCYPERRGFVLYETESTVEIDGGFALAADSSGTPALAVTVREIRTADGPSAALARARDWLQRALEPIPLPPAALDLGGCLTLGDLGLFAATLGDSVAGQEEYFGIGARLVPGPEALLAGRTSATSSASLARARAAALRP
jgi:hypothetical protein